MTTSSAQPIYSDTLDNDTITLTSGAIGSDFTYTTATGSSYFSAGGVGGGAGSSTITITGGGSGYSTIGSTISFNSPASGAGGGFIAQTIDDSIYSWKEEFDGRFPEWDRIQDMCKEYPGLKIAFEKFKTTYYLVKDHYDTPEDQRPLP